MRTTATLLFILIAFHAPASRADACDDAVSQADMTVCAAKAFTLADRQLNDAYKEIGRRLDEDAATKKLLVAAQRDWIAFRDSECRFQASASVGGSIYPMLVATCRTEITNERIEHFRTYLACEEGDMSCPVPAAQ